MRTLLLISRLLVGLLFIFSGLIKANDPLGFSYKLEEYFNVFDTEGLIPFALALSIFICVIEIVLGVAVLLGSRMKIVAPLLLIMIIFFTFLTGYSAYTGAVSDCGCFGDAIKLTPFQSFLKDLVLLIFILVIYIKRKTIFPTLKERTADLLVLVSGIVSFGFTWLCYTHLPVIDFLPYKKGNNLPQLMTVPPGEVDVYKTTLVYKNKTSGEEKEFDMTNIPTDTVWEWKETKNVLVKEGAKAKIHDFVIMDENGDSLTQQLIRHPEYNFIIIGYNLDNSDKEGFKEINSLADAAINKKIKVTGLTASSAAAVKALQKELNIKYPFYYADGTLLKTIIRSNPGILLMKNGTVVDKWHHNDTPEFEDIEKNYLQK